MSNWQPVRGAEKLYEITSDGLLVRSLASGRMVDTFWFGGKRYAWLFIHQGEAVQHPVEPAV